MVSQSRSLRRQVVTQEKGRKRCQKWLWLNGFRRGRKPRLVRRQVAEPAIPS